MYAREAFERDRDNWKSVILLNVVRCMQRVVDCLVQADAADEDDSTEEFPPDAPPPLSSLITDTHRHVCLRLRASLDLAERGLKARLSPHTSGANLPRSRPATAEQLVDKEAEAELTVQAHSYAFLPHFPDVGTNKPSRRLSTLPPPAPVDPSDPNDPNHLIMSCRQDMMDLWTDPVVKEILARRKIRWQEWPGLYVTLSGVPDQSSHHFSFLNDLERVTATVSHLSGAMIGLI